MKRRRLIPPPRDKPEKESNAGGAEDSHVLRVSGEWWQLAEGCYWKRRCPGAE